MAMSKDVLTETGIVAAGTNLATAYELRAAVNIVGTVAASTGVRLPAAAPGTHIFVRNNGANELKVYPNTAAGKINGGVAGAAKALATTNDSSKSRLFVCAGDDDWYSLEYPAS